MARLFAPEIAVVATYGVVPQAAAAPRAPAARWPVGTWGYTIVTPAAGAGPLPRRRLSEPLGGAAVSGLQYYASTLLLATSFLTASRCAARQHARCTTVRSTTPTAAWGLMQCPRPLSHPLSPHGTLLLPQVDLQNSVVFQSVSPHSYRRGHSPPPAACQQSSVQRVRSPHI